MHTQPHKPRPLSLLGVICDKEKRDRVIKVLEAHKALFHLGSHGRGTANSKILGYLGLGETEKRVFFSMMPTDAARDAMRALDEALEFKKPGHGVAYRADIYEGCYHRLVHIPHEERGETTVENRAANDLVMVVVNRGYTEEVMDAARAAGATGGTVLHARGCGLEGAEKFFGITIQPEKEIIMILARADASCGIMQQIAEDAGPESDAGAVSFSMPVASVRGIGSDVPDDFL